MAPVFSLIKEVHLSEPLSKTIQHMKRANLILYSKTSSPRQLYIWRFNENENERGEADCLEFESNITAIGEWEDLLLVGDSDGYVTVLETNDLLGESSISPLTFDKSPIRKFCSENYVLTEAGNWYRLQKDAAANYKGIKLEFSSAVYDVLKFDSVLTWPLESLSLAPPNETLLCIGKGPCIALYREDHGLNLGKLASSALGFFKTEKPSTESVSMAVIERLDDAERGLHHLFSSNDLVIAVDNNRAQVLAIDPRHLVIIHLFKGYRDVVCWNDADGAFCLASNKRKVIEKWHPSLHSMLARSNFAADQKIVTSLGGSQLLLLKGDRTLQIVKF